MGKERVERKTVFLWPGNMLFVLSVGVVMCITCLVIVAESRAAGSREERSEINLSQVRQGELLLAGTGEGQYLPAPRLSQEVKIYISGIVARTIVHQRFVNSTKEWQEARYVFPLPDESAVDQLHMQIGNRIVKGEIREKKEARKVYEQARKEGKKASLLSQERPNIFTMVVANIGPGEEVAVAIEYQQVVGFRDGIFSLRFPMVVGPRYIPGRPLSKDAEQGEVHFTGAGWSLDTDQVPDASRITPPVVSGSKKLNPVQLLVELAAGFPVARLDSLYHGIVVQDEEGEKKLVRFDGEVKADRDFVLEWEAEQLKRPKAALFAETRGGQDYLLLMLMPPEVGDMQEAPARELIFVIDTSGSMAGPSIIQAREALVLAISRLTDRDRFNVIAFSSHADKLFAQEEQADSKHRNKAIRFVQSLQAEGGTEIAEALELALDGKQRHERIRQVIFLTDGSVGNEKDLLAAIGSRLGDSRLFTVGIGSAPNSYFMSRAAALGRGSFTYIGKVTEIHERMAELFRKLENPALTDITVTAGNGQPLELYPDPIPDLYPGEPLVVSLKLPAQNDTLRISGRVGSRQWQEQVHTETLARRPGVAALWARKKIRSLMDILVLGGEEQEIRKKILEIALEHHLVSRYSSLVAVEKQVSRLHGQGLKQSSLKTNMPHGWQADKIFGGTSRTATPAQLCLLLGVFLLLAALLLLFWKRRVGA